MLSDKIKNLISLKGWHPLSPDDKLKYEQTLIDLGVSPDCVFGEFNLAIYGPTFLSRGYELYNVCWFKLYSDDLEYAITSAEENLGLPLEYLPLDNFEAKSGFFYNRATGEVLKLELGENWDKYCSGDLQPLSLRRKTETTWHGCYRKSWRKD